MNDQNPKHNTLLLWPGVVAVVLQWLSWFVVPMVAPGAAGFGVLAGLACGLAVLVWWIFFSRARWSERLGAVVLIALTLTVTLRLVHKSIAGGMMGLMLYIYAIPLLSLALVVWAVAWRSFAQVPRPLLLVAAIVLGCVPLTLLRTDGITGDGASQLAWRWSKTPEQRLLAESLRRTASPPPVPVAAETPVKQPGEGSSKKPTLMTPASPATKMEGWPGFRGLNRDSVIPGVRINADWSAFPPARLWDRPVGPGWSSFAVQGDLLFTQEQRGDEEVVACYRVTTGEPVWKHSDAARFWESNAGAGPRATPTLCDGRVYAFGGTGILNALDAQDGTVVWTRNAASDIGKKVPQWGFAGQDLEPPGPGRQYFAGAQRPGNGRVSVVPRSRGMIAGPRD